MEEGNLAYSQGRYAAAEVIFADSLKEAESWPAEDAHQGQNEMAVRLTKSLNNMAALFHAQGKYKMAEDIYLKALDIKQRIYPEESEEIAVALQNLAILYSAKRDYPQAESYFIKTLRIREKVLGENHPDLANTLQKYAVVLDKLGRKEESENLQARASNILATSGG
jgi:tetratricopeptide (TPR) repeat protein